MRCAPPRCSPPRPQSASSTRRAAPTPPWSPTRPRSCSTCSPSTSGSERGASVPRRVSPEQLEAQCEEALKEAAELRRMYVLAERTSCIARERRDKALAALSEGEACYAALKEQLVGAKKR